MKKNKCCYVYGAGEHYDAPAASKTEDYVIAVDGGYDFLNKYSVIPDVLIGDLDSLSQIPEDISLLRLPCEKDETDMLAALDEGLKKDFSLFHIFGGTGGRIDHTLSNIQCLAYLAEKGARGFLYEKDNVLTVIKDEEIQFPSSAQGYISVFALSDYAYGVNERGLKYRLDDAVLRSIYPQGVSNEFAGTKSRVWVASGSLLIVYPKGIEVEME